MESEKGWLFSKIEDHSQDVIGMSQAQFGSLLKIQRDLKKDLYDVLKDIIMPVAKSKFTVPKTNLLKALIRYDGEENMLKDTGVAILEANMSQDELLKRAILNRK